MPRPPSRSPLHEGEPDDLEHLEELGDDAIISQQTAAHTPQPRANVSEEARSVVITDHPLRRDTHRPREAPARAGGEQTLVIRDRRALDELRRNMMRHKVKKADDRSSLYLWGALGLAAFVLGGVVAFLVTDSHPDAPTTLSAVAAPKRVETHVGPLAAAPRVAAKPAATAAPEPNHAVRLDDLPVERR